MTDCPTGAAPAARRRTYWDFPYPHYREMQRETPVHYDEYLSAWLVTSYSATLDALRHPQLSSAWIPHRADQQGPGATDADYVGSVMSRWFVFADAPEHGRLRKAVNKAFTPRVVADLVPQIERRAAGLLAGALKRGGMVNVMTELTTPLSAGVIADLIGLGDQVAAELPRWGTVFAKTLANAARTDVAGETAEVLREISAAVRARLTDAPPGSLLHELTAPAAGPRLSLDDLVGTVGLLLYAGLESTSHLMGLSVLALLDHPQLRDELSAAGPAAVAGAVEELLRYDGPVLQVARVATADLELEGSRIKRGDLVVVLLGAANHDERRFADPDRLDLRRDASRHLGFGHGIHFCIGAALARAETTVFLTAVLRDAPGFASAGAPLWGSRNAVRTLDHLPVTLR